MSDPVREQLSAYLDGELPEPELDLLVKRLNRNAELEGALGRYALISECLKADRPVRASSSFARNVMAAVEREAQPSVSRFRASPDLIRRLRPAAGLAVAAGVAAVVVLSLQQQGGVDAPLIVGNETVEPAPESFRATVPDPSYTVPSTTPTGAFIPAARLTNYVVAHSEYSSPLGRRTVLSGMLSEDDETTVLTDDAADESEAQVSIP